MAKAVNQQISVDSSEAYYTRELSWLHFAGRVLHQVERSDLPLLERVKFAGIMGMIHDEFFMKRIGGLKRQVEKNVDKVSLDGRKPIEELMECRAALLEQLNALDLLLEDDLLPKLRKAGISILHYGELTEPQQEHLAGYFAESVQPILTPLAVDDEHPFPFISNLGLNIAVQIKDTKKAAKRFVRIKIPDNRPRWIALPEGEGYVPLEQVIANNLALLFPGAKSIGTYFFRVTRGAEGERTEENLLEDQEMPLFPGSLLRQVTGSLKARKFAGVVRLEISPDMPEKMQDWLAGHLGISHDDVYTSGPFMGYNDLLKLSPEGFEHLCAEPHVQVTHPRLKNLNQTDANEIFREIRRGDILLHHPYHSFDTSVLHFIRSAAIDPKVLGIKLTIYRTSSDSPIVQALIEAVRRGKQVAVMVEITARFDEAPNIAWCELLEREGVHVAYGVEKLKTHVKLALVIREEKEGIRRYVHVGTGNYHTGTARIYEDLGLLTCDPELGADAAAVFNELTGSYSHHDYNKLLVAPVSMLSRFIELIQREAEHAEAGRPSGIRAKMNQLQEPDIIRELYRAGQAGVPITLNVRGLCCLRAQVPGLSENIAVFSVIGRFLEHSRIYRFENGGSPEYFIGSADWMRRNMRRRIETIAPVEDPLLQKQLDEILTIYESDNCSAWDMGSNGEYKLRQPAGDESCRRAQEQFIRLTG